LSSRGKRETGGRGGLPMNAEINVTSLIDVAFTLLVIFIITAPIMQGGIEVRLPQAQVQPLEPAESPFILNIMEDGTIIIGEDTVIEPAEFADVFPQLFAAAAPTQVFIRGDSLATYGRIIDVMATVAGVTRDAGVPWRLVAQERPNQ